MHPNTLSAIADKHRGILHTLEQIDYAERFVGHEERERQLQRLCDKCDDYRSWLQSHMLQHERLPSDQLPWHDVVTVLCDPPGGARERWLDEARSALTECLTRRSHHDTICELAKLDPSWWSQSEAAEVEAYMATLTDDQRAAVEAVRADTAD